MKNEAGTDIGRIFLRLALIVLISGLAAGVLASQSYLIDGFLKTHLGFVKLRPMHVSLVLFWILSGAIGSVYSALCKITGEKINPAVAVLHLALWLTSIAGVVSSYVLGRFGGREYWEFDPVWSLPIALSWLIFLYSFVTQARKIRQWPVYVWMWMTGIAFFSFTYAENHLWLLDYFRQSFVRDMTVQWKVNGSLVGSMNQLVYGTAFYIMHRLNPAAGLARSRTVFLMYFLGLFNLMFNWGHHIYTLPTMAYVKYTGYAVSMTEWIIFIRIVHQWKSSLEDARKNYHLLPYRFILAADAWVFLNLFVAILMSVPAINVYTHGTHITVAHAMGTTIGISTMILLGACFFFLSEGRVLSPVRMRRATIWFWCTQGSLLVFWLSLNVAGIRRAMWQMDPSRPPFSTMMEAQRIPHVIFAVSGLALMACLTALALILLRLRHTVTLPKKPAPVQEAHWHS